MRNPDTGRWVIAVAAIVMQLKDGGSITINNATIQNDNMGLMAFSGGSVHFQMGTVQNNNFAAIAGGGTLLIGGRITASQSGVRQSADM